MHQRFERINDFLYYIGVNDRETHLFENQFPIPQGVTYNSYLLTAEKTALLDTVKITKVDEFVENIESVLKGRKLDYLVIHHMEPDHSGSIRLIQKLYPEVVLVGNKLTFDILEKFQDINLSNRIIVHEGEQLNLGDRSLTFFSTPMVHWPESMVSIENKSGTLFSQDIFGSFAALDGVIFDDELDWSIYAKEVSRYYTNIVGYHSNMAQKAVAKLDGVKINLICPTHGPVWRSYPEKIIDLYVRLATWQVEHGVVIVYGSMYGNTASLSDKIARELSIQGISKIRVFDVSKTDPSFILDEIWRNRGLILASVSYHNGLYLPMQKLLLHLKDARMKNHILGYVASYSWSGGAYKELEKFAQDFEGNQVLQGNFEFRSSPDYDDIHKGKLLAREMARKLEEKRNESAVNILKI